MDINLSTPRSSVPNRWWLRLLSLGLGLLCWQITSQVTGLAVFILPPPAAVWDRFVVAITEGTLLLDIGVTLSEVILGLLAGVALATVLGYSVAKSRPLERVLSPYLVASQAIPIVAIAPLLVLWFGYGMFSKVLICALIVFFPVLINIIVGIRAVPQAFYDLMNSLHASKRQVLLKVEIPAALPIFLGGLRVGATLSVIGAVVGELVGANYGLGNLITRGRVSYDMPLVYVGVFMLVIMALTLYALVSGLEKKFLKWQESFEK
jgi:NitT/TauT family transport system permease protein